MSAEKLNKIRELKSEILFLTQRVQELVSEIDVEVLSLVQQQNNNNNNNNNNATSSPPRPQTGGATVAAAEETYGKRQKKERMDLYRGSWSDEESDASPLSPAEDSQSQASVSEEDEDTDNFRSHLEQYGIKMTFVPILTVRNARAYTCSVFGFTAKGVAKTKKAAKRKAMIAVAKTIIRKQEEGVLPTDIEPFACDELANLMSLMESKDGRDYVSELKVLCQELQAPPPEYTVLAAPSPAPGKAYTVRCSALSHSCTGTHAIKKKAKMNSAREILKLHEGTALD